LKDRADAASRYLYLVGRTNYFLCLGNRGAPARELEKGYQNLIRPTEELAAKKEDTPTEVRAAARNLNRGYPGAAIDSV
jgi:hypothetical protein